MNANFPANSEPQYRNVTILVPILPWGLYDQTVVSQSCAIDTEEGILVAFQTPMGIRGVNRYSVVEAGGGGGLCLREEARLTGPRVLMGFTMGTERVNHQKHREAVVEEMERRAGGSGGG